MHNLELTDDEGCSVTESITLSSPADGEDASFDFDDFCEGESNGPSNISTPGGTFSWGTTPTDGASIDPTTGVISNAVGGTTYTIEYTTNGACAGTETVTVTVFEAPDFTVQSTSPSCGLDDGNITITAINIPALPITYSIGNGNDNTTGIFNGLAAGTYTLTLTDANGCSSTDQVTLSNADGPDILSVNSTPASCAGNDGTITVIASGGTAPLSYSVNNGTPQANGTFTGLAPGSYVITVSDANGCESSETVVISSADAPVISIDSQNNVSCFGANDGSAQVGVTGGTQPYTFTWTPAVSTTASVANLAPGNYTVTVSDANGCESSLSITITEPNPIEIQASATDASCGLDDGEITLTVSGGTGTYTFQWTPSVSTSNQATGLSAGTYSVTVSDANGCSETITQVVESDGTFPIEATPAYTEIELGESVDIEVFVDPAIVIEDITWNPTNGLSCDDCLDPTATPNQTTTYIITVVDENGCLAQDTVVIHVNLPCSDVFVPNTFSPNSDGTNDYQCVFGSCIVSMEFSIFNRWGERVFFSDSTNDCWDGTFRDKPVQSGVYFYKLNATLKNGEEIHDSGDITVLH